MRRLLPRNIRTRLTVWYMGVLALVLTVYLVIVLIFQYNLLATQIYHDEIQDVETVEGLLVFDPQGEIHLRQDYLSHPQSHLLTDRLMEVRNSAGDVLYRSETLRGMRLGPAEQTGDEGANAFYFHERITRLVDGTFALMISHRHPVQGQMLLIRLGYSLAPLEERMERFFIALVLALPVALVVAGFGGYHMARRALAPLDSMSARAERITASNLSGRLEIEDEQDELGRMARVLNSLLSRLERSFAQLQRFTADAAHELKTPLTSIRAVGEGTLHRDPPVEVYREAVSSMLEETSRLNQTVEGLLLISRAEANELTLQITVFPLRELVEEIVSLLEAIVEECGVRIVQPDIASSETLVAADRTLLRTCILNVLHNAIKFSPPGGRIEVSYQHLERDAGRLLRLGVLDQGPGIAESDRQRVFERFFRVRETKTTAAEGAGLGLAIAKLAIETTHGSISFAPPPLQGALCCIDIPGVDV
jgi:signal transduction histidine kinase